MHDCVISELLCLVYALRDCYLFAAANTFASMLSGCVIFATLGYMSHVTGIAISEVADSGPGLAFVAYPKALSTLPIAPLWSILFFLMLFLLGLDSQVGDFVIKQICSEKR